MLIRSGDVVIMSGASRLCYHGVPRILSSDQVPWNDVDLESECLQRKEKNLASFPSCLSSEIIHSCAEDCFWEPFGNYLRTSRINMNVRQVLHPGVESLHVGNE